MQSVKFKNHLKTLNSVSTQEFPEQKIFLNSEFMDSVDLGQLEIQQFIAVDSFVYQCFRDRFSPGSPGWSQIQYFPGLDSQVLRMQEYATSPSIMMILCIYISEYTFIKLLMVKFAKSIFIHPLTLLSKMISFKCFFSIIIHIGSLNLIVHHFISIVILSYLRVYVNYNFLEVCFLFNFLMVLIFTILLPYTITYFCSCFVTGTLYSPSGP